MIPGVRALPSLRPPLTTHSIWSDDGGVYGLAPSGYPGYSFRNVLDLFLLRNAAEFRFTFQNTIAIDHCSFGIWTGAELSTRRTPIEILFRGKAGFIGDGVDSALQPTSDDKQTIVSDWMTLGEDVLPGEFLVVILDVSSTAPNGYPALGVVRPYVAGSVEKAVTAGPYSDWSETYLFYTPRPGCFYKAGTDSYNVASVSTSGWTDSAPPLSVGGLPALGTGGVYNPRRVMQLRQIEAR
jgi:hypothetical protein